MLRKIGIKFSYVLFIFLLFTDLAYSLDFFNKALELYNKGNFESAANNLSKVLKNTSNVKEKCEIKIELAKCYLAMGNVFFSKKEISEALAIQKKYKLNFMPEIQFRLGNANTFLGKLDLAEKSYKEAVKLSVSKNNIELIPSILNNLGNLYVLKHKYLNAFDSYKSGTIYSEKLGNDLLSAKLLANAAKAAFNMKNTGLTLKFLKKSLEKFIESEISYEQILGMINIGLTYKMLSEAKWLNPKVNVEDIFYNSYKILNDAKLLAKKFSSPRLSAFCYGYISDLFKLKGDLQSALKYSRKAVIFSQSAKYQDYLYEWEFRSAEILKEIGDYEHAVTSYLNSIDSVKKLQYAMAKRNKFFGKSYRDSVSPIFYGLADIYLKIAKKYSGNYKKNYLLKARKIVESMKIAEMQNYFKNSCAVALKAKAKSLDSVDKTSAIVYLIPLKNRLEILLSMHSNIEQFSVKVNSKKLMNNALKFRKYVVRRTTRQYLKYSYRLYNWIINPIEKTLEKNKIKTLIFVPDGALQSMPFAALRDKIQKKYLIEKFSIGITPGLDLTDPEPIKRKNIKIFLGGISKSVQGYPEIPSVVGELSEIESIYKGDVMLNNSFVSNKFESYLNKNSYSIVHIASHGEFLKDSGKSFLLSWDRKINMDDLEKYLGNIIYKNQPVELLTLSACKTAAGDELSALGLAGVAIKSGARSAVASLWYVNDKSSSELIVNFYKYLKNNSLSKAQSLQQAQIKLLKNKRYRHPLYWAGFVMIGNWL